MTHYLADFPIEILALMIPIMALMIPIVAILVHHQQKMAAIIHQGGGPEARAQIEALKAELAQLRTLVHQQAIQMDSVASASRARNGAHSLESGSPRDVLEA